MGVLDRIATARDDLFSARVAMIAMKLAVDVSNESAQTANHANRLTFANKVFRAEVNSKALAAAIIAHNATIQSTIDSHPELRGSNVPDGDIEFELSSIYNNLANAYA